MAIKETPVNLKHYYKILIEDIAHNKELAVKEQEALSKKEIEQYNELKSCSNLYKNKYKINLEDYDEFKNNKYVNGRFLKFAKAVFTNSHNNYELQTDLYYIYDLANSQYTLYTLNREIKLYNKILELNLKDYTEILRVFMTEVHKKMILEGNGYAFGENIGWICINRCLLHKPKPRINFAATKRREKELKESGAKIYNKEEAEWCKQNGINYNAEDKRVFLNDEYCYEIPLIGCKLTNGTKYKLTIADYRHSSIRGKTNEDLIKECNNDLTKICELPVDIKTKLTMCDSINKKLYIKFIRNEAQQSINAPKANRKD